MSLGYGAICHLVLEDDDVVIYEYGGFNWNIPKYRNSEYVCDGYITIYKSALVEPEIRQKKKENA